MITSGSKLHITPVTHVPTQTKHKGLIILVMDAVFTLMVLSDKMQQYVHQKPAWEGISFFVLHCHR